MRTLLFIALLIPVAAMASSYSNAPLLVVKPEQEAAPVQTYSIAPATPAPAPATPPRVTAPQPPKPDKPERPESHAIESTAVQYSKLWPRDSVPIFMTRCTKFHTEAVKPCSCIITRVMTEMTHDEFMKISESGNVEKDARLLAIRTDCLSKIAPQDLKTRNVNMGRD